MRLSDEMPMDPDILAELEVIDLTLAGEPVDPEYAELAELALMLQMERTEPEPEFARMLDARANHRFKTLAPAGGGRRPRPGRWDWLQSPGWRAGIVGAAAAVAIGVFAITANHGGGSSSGSATTSMASTTSSASPLYNGDTGVSTGSSTSASSTTAGGTATSSGAGAVASSSTTSYGTATTPSIQHDSANSSSTPSAGAGASRPAAANSLGQAVKSAAPSPHTGGRKVIQSAQLTLTASNDRIDTVSQEIFDAVSQAHGIVMSSHVNSVAGKNGGSAFFRLSIPTGNLEQTLSDLSKLSYAHVVSRTNNTQDVTKTYRSDQQRLQDAQALRTSLLKQLAQAVTQTEIDSLKAQLHDAEVQIGNAQYALKHLQHRVSYSTVSVRLYSGHPPVVTPKHHSSSGFTLGGAVHTAGRVLVVAAGVILIGAAALVPLALLGLLVLWIVMWLRRRSREQALDHT